MRTPPDIYSSVIAARDLESAVSRLDDAHLATLLGWMNRNDGNLPWPATVVRGVAMVEAVDRFMKMESGRTGAVGEGNV